MRHLGDHALGVRVLHVASEAASGVAAIEAGGEHHIAQRQARTPDLLRRLDNAGAQLAEELHEQVALLRLPLVIGSPGLLAVRDAESARHFHVPVRIQLALDDELQGNLVLAGPPGLGVVRAGAVAAVLVQDDGVLGRQAL